jgi:AraC-like DNA-binding protein
MSTIYDSDMLYSEEHLNSPNYQREVKHGFTYREYPDGSVVTSDGLDANVIIFMLQGALKFDCCTNHENILRPGNMLFMPIKTLCHLEYEAGSIVIEMHFEDWDFSCVTTPFNSLRSLSNYVDNSANVLKINDKLEAYLNLLTVYLRNGVSCDAFHKLKINEFFILLRHFYSKEQIAVFLAPVLGGSQDFRMSCLKMRATSRNISDMVARSGMSKTKFYDVFRKEFGDVNPKKWFDSYLEYRILHEASKPEASVKQLTYTLDFDSESAFSQYCNRHFGMSASDLIKSRKKRLEAL